MPAESHSQIASFIWSIREKATADNQVIKLRRANPFDKFQLGLRQLIEDLMVQRMTACAIEELQGERREQLKIFLLALHLGLRRGEIDKLLWRQFDFDRCQLHVEATEFSQLKTEGSECDIGLESELRDFFRAEFQAAQSIFVIDTQIQPRPSQIYAHYRAASEFTTLCAWLRAHGVVAQKPIHTLRKEFGRLITEKMGLYAASLALRHTSTAVTSIYYADDTRPKHTGLGRLLAKVERPDTPGGRAATGAA